MLLVCLLNPGCKQNTNPSSLAPEEKALIDTLPGDFLTFFNRFHTDSLYQMAHILFPLEGLPNSVKADEAQDTTRFFWQKKEWKQHNLFTDPSHHFEHWYEVTGDRLIDHWIQMKGTNMFIHRRFAKLEDGWYLIYYAGMRPSDKQRQGK